MPSQSLRSLLLASVAAAALATSFPKPSNASGIPVVDAAHIAATTQAEVARAYSAALDYAKQVAIYANQVEQYVNAVTNTLAIPQQALSVVSGYYYRAQGVANTASYIVSGEGSMVQRARMFSGMARGGANMPQSAAASMEMIRQQAALQLDENIRLLGLESERKQINDAMLASAQNNSAMAIGRMAALQAASQNTASAAAQMQQTNAMLSNMVTAQQVKDAMAIADDERYGIERVADVAAARVQADTPATIASPITWGR